MIRSIKNLVNDTKWKCQSIDHQQLYKIRWKKYTFIKLMTLIFFFLNSFKMIIEMKMWLVFTWLSVEPWHTIENVRFYHKPVNERQKKNIEFNWFLFKFHLILCTPIKINCIQISYFTLILRLLWSKNILLKACNRIIFFLCWFKMKINAIKLNSLPSTTQYRAYSMQEIIENAICKMHLKLS